MYNENMPKKLWEKVKGFFEAPELSETQPALHPNGFIPDKMHTSRHENNMENIALAELKLQREALQKNLSLMHKTIVIAILAVLVSIVLGVYAVKSKQDIKVQPQIEVHLDKQKTN